MSITLSSSLSPVLSQIIGARLHAQLGLSIHEVTLADSLNRSDKAWTAEFAKGQFELIVPVTLPESLRGNRRTLSTVYLRALQDRPFAPLTCALADSIVESEYWKQECQHYEQKLDHSLYQITASFEELTWLRTLAEHFEICSLADGLARTGQATLPALRQLIFAQELYLFANTQAVEMGAHQPQLLAHDGAGLVDQQSALALLIRLTCQPDEQLIVWNTPMSGNRTEYAEAVRNCIVVPVFKANELHGWLLAINKCMPLEDDLWHEAANQDQNLIEFGTSEAGLMSTMAIMLATHAKNVNLLCEKEELLMGVLRALVTTIDAKDAYTGGHSDRVANYSKQIAQRLGLLESACEEIYMSGLLHDIGKIGVPDAVLGKPGRLTDEEFEQIKRHPTIGFEILKPLKPFAYLLPGVLHHHESFDGSGYPQGLAGESISLMGRIIAVADSYDAMTSDRTYRPGMPREKANQILRSGQGKQWDPDIVDAFLKE